LGVNKQRKVSPKHFEIDKSKSSVATHKIHKVLGSRGPTPNSGKKFPNIVRG
jgi:hypothetical protein